MPVVDLWTGARIMKRSADECSDGLDGSKTSKEAKLDTKHDSNFRNDLFDQASIQEFATKYATSAPYQHAVVHDLLDDNLLRRVKAEVEDNIEFSAKETDIYRIHQSGDLANLDGLPASALKMFPNLLKLRDALYSSNFRQWISQVTNAGPLSGRKTDMAVNVYVPGCHLLCHDDVIGSRRISYILYLTNPDQPWLEHWGGSLRLYPTDEEITANGAKVNIPRPQWSKKICPSWNQLAFFAVQPGASFHDVEEVYRQAHDESMKGEKRVRMAISGWFHIPQEGEDGFEPGLEAELAGKSSLRQLQGRDAELDLPNLAWLHSGAGSDPEQVSSESELDLTEGDLDFLIKFVNPHYLTPDNVQDVNDQFGEESLVHLQDFLSPRFAGQLKTWIEKEAHQPTVHTRKFATSRPPHKHRYRYLLPREPDKGVGDDDNSPLDSLLNELFPSSPFRKWLSLVTGLTLQQSAFLARRFRRGLDYQLAQTYEGQDPQLEYCLCVTPTPDWGPSDDGDDAEGGTKTSEAENFGGYELYMAGDEADSDETASSHGCENPTSNKPTQSHTGAGERRPAKSSKSDPAVYQSTIDGEDDGILLSSPASWNTMTIVLRDCGTLRFVKYVSQSAPGDRWDVAGFVRVKVGEEDGADEAEEDRS